MAIKRSNGEGSWRMKNKLWEYRVSLPSANGVARKKSFYGKTKTLCLNKYKNYITKTGNIALDDRVTLGQMADKYLSLQKADITDYTRSDYERTVRLHIRPFAISEKRMIDIRSIDIRELLNMPCNCSSASMQAKITWHLSSIFQLAIENDVCYKNPCQNIAIKGRTKEATQENTYMLDECVAIRDFCLQSDESAAMPVLVLLYTGMRQGELLGLQWNDLDFETKTIAINRTAATTGSGKKYIKQYTKTSAGMRQVPLLPQLEKVLAPLQRKSLFIVHTAKLDFYNPKTFNQKVYKKFIMSIPNIRVLGTHAFRHAIATHLGNSGASKEDIAKIIGHKDTSVTERIYWLYDMKKAGVTMQMLPY